jgi:toxin CcdB
MPRFDVFRLNQRTARYVVDLQSDFLSHLATRVVAPLFTATELAPAASELNPIFEIEGRSRALFPQLLAALPKSDLKTPIANLAPHRDQITRALDLLLTGF